MDPRVLKLRTPKDCEQFAKNVSERGRPDLAQEARRRAIEIRAESYGAETEAERQCLQAIYAYEELLSAKNGRRTRASRTWQMINRYGLLEAVERAVNRESDASGYTALAEMGLEDLSFEAIVSRYPDLFSQETVERANERISKRNDA